MEPHSLHHTTVYWFFSRILSPAHVITFGISELLSISLRWRFGLDTARVYVLHPASRRMSLTQWKPVRTSGLLGVSVPDLDASWLATLSSP